MRVQLCTSKHCSLGWLGIPTSVCSDTKLSVKTTADVSEPPFVLSVGARGSGGGALDPCARAHWASRHCREGGRQSSMKIGVVFPQTELGGDVGAVRAYGEAVEELGFHHLLAYDHVVGADPAVHGLAGPYDIDTTFHEPFVMFGYLAAVTSLELVTGIIILPAAPDRARGQAGGRGRPAHRGPVPPRRRPRLERRGVRGAGQGLHRPGSAARPSRSSCCAGCGPSGR